MRLDSGDVVVLPFPYSDLLGEKQRPVLVLTPEAYHKTSSVFVAAYVTSQPQRDRWAVPLGPRDLADGALVKPSWVRADKLATVEQRLARKVVARLAPKALEAVRGKLKVLLLQ